MDDVNDDQHPEKPAHLSNLAGAASTLQLWQRNFEMLGLMSIPYRDKGEAIDYYRKNSKSIHAEYTPSHVERALNSLSSQCMEWAALPEQAFEAGDKMRYLNKMLTDVKQYTPIFQATADRLNAEKLTYSDSACPDDLACSARYFTTIANRLCDMQQDIGQSIKGGVIQVGAASGSMVGRHAKNKHEVSIAGMHGMLVYEYTRNEIYAFLPQQQASLEAIERATFDYAKSKCSKEQAIAVYRQHGANVLDAINKLELQDKTDDARCFSILAFAGALEHALDRAQDRRHSCD